MKTAKIGDVVQLQIDSWANGVLMEVDSVKTWGYTGTVHAPHGQELPMRARFDEVKTVWHRVPDG